MMMAHEWSPESPASISDETITALRSALVSYVQDPSQAGQLRPVLQRLADEAHGKAIVAEQVLILLKQVWYTLPNTHELPSSEDRVHLLQRVVTMCIREYYDE